MPKKQVKVYVRTRPTDNFSKQISIDEEKNDISVQKHIVKHEVVNNQQTSWSFRLNRILHNGTQEQVYDEVVRELVDQVLQGYNGTVLTYGQTGAGKTFTVIGGQNEFKNRGLVPRVVQHIFEAIQGKPETLVVMRFSALEIYNNQLFDLLVEDGEPEPALGIFDDSSGNVCVRGLKRPAMNSEEEALNLLFQAVTNRAVGPHAMNRESSRSHAIFTIYLDMRSRIESSEKVVTSKIHLVDLAGSERIKKTGSSGTVLKEAGYINQSLTFLEQVVMALGSRSRDHIPFRSSKLTNFLRDSLGGNCQTRLIANIWPMSSLLEETVSTLKFATRMMRVTTTSSMNVQLDPMLLIKKYEREIRSLKQELALHDTLAGRAPQSWNAISEDETPEQQAKTMEMVRSYVKGDLEEIEVKTLRQIRAVCQQFRVLVNQLECNQLRDIPKSSESSSDRKQEIEANGGKEESDNGKVGEMDMTGLSVGLAPADARPLETTALPQKKVEAAEETTETKQQTEPLLRKSEDEAFVEFQEVEGASLARNYQEQKSNLKSKKRQMKALAVKINESKREIDRLVTLIEDKKSSRPQGDASGDQIIDEEEYAYLRDLNARKKSYQNDFYERKMLQSEVTFLKGAVEQSKLKMCHEFLSWYRTKYGVLGGETEAKNNDKLDNAEAFEILEAERVRSQAPGSLAFFKATKNMSKARKNSRRRRL